MNSKILQKLQYVEYEIFQEVVRICKKNDITYFLVGGTLLGAIRHKGFIPWDDDLDIAMPREDYNRFLKICKDQLNENFYLHCNQTDPEYWLPYAKVRKNGTLFLEKPLISIKSHKGIFIDIFPLDNANTQNSLIQDLQAVTVKGLLSLIMFKRGLKIGKPSWKMKISLTLTKGIQLHKLCVLQQKIMSFNRNPKAEYYINLGSNYDYTKQTIPKNKYFPPVKVEFNGGVYNAPNDWDYVLKRIYGDYMKIPEVNKRVTHSPAQIEFAE